MGDFADRTALVTGANSGLGYETAAQLADQGYGTVIITARTDEKSRTAREALEFRTGKDVFKALAIDNDVLETVEAAAAILTERGRKIDLLVLNAGVAPAKDISRTRNGIETTASASLVGHHLLTMRLLERDLLQDTARVVIAGSEAARGDVPTFTPLDVNAFAREAR